MSMRLRLLPTLIIFALVSLGVKSYELGEGVRLTAPTANVAQAQTTTPEGLPDETPTVAEQAAADAEAARMEARGEAEERDPRRPVSRSAFLAEEPSLTQSEIEVLQALKARREEIDAREQEFEQRLALLESAERRVEQKIADLASQEAELRRVLRQVDEEKEAQIQSMVRVYEIMKPKAAAEIWNEMELPVLLDVISRMKERRVAEILASVRPDRAEEITIRLLRRSDLPETKE